jgi:transcriptional regulator with XRE-family HTH domain
MALAHTAAVLYPQANYAAPAIPPPFLFGDTMPMGYSTNIAMLRKRQGLTQAALAERLKVEQPTVTRWENGKRELTVATLIEIADALGVEPGALLTKDSAMPMPLGPTLYCKGKIAAGRWKAAVEDPEDEWASFTGRPDVKADIAHRFGLKIEGDSMDELYPDGTIVECVSVFGHTEIAAGKRVVVVRENTDGLYEATVKELVEDAAGEMWAVPRSTNPAHQSISLTKPEQGIVNTRIAAVVVASHRPE